MTAKLDCMNPVVKLKCCPLFVWNMWLHVRHCTFKIKTVTSSFLTIIKEGKTVTIPISTVLSQLLETHIDDGHLVHLSTVAKKKLHEKKSTFLLIQYLFIYLFAYDETEVKAWQSNYPHREKPQQWATLR